MRKSRLWWFGALVGAALVSCSGGPEVRELGRVGGGKGDFTGIENVPFVIDAASATAQPAESDQVYRVTVDAPFRVVVNQATSQPLSVAVTGVAAASSDQAEQIDWVVPVNASGEAMIIFRNHGAGPASGTFSLLPPGGTPPPPPGPTDWTISDAVYDGAKLNLQRIAKEIDPSHLAKYNLSGPIEDQFLEALYREYAGHPDQLGARIKALASAIFFAAPEIAPPADGGRPTPFHGLDMDDFGALMNIQDKVFSYLVSQKNNGVLAGVRPFSVCEVKFQIDKYVKPGRSYGDFETYRDAYAVYASSCAPQDLTHWYNFRGLGHMRPTWMESNIMERFVRRMVKACDVQQDPAYAADCQQWNAGRLAYRLDHNRQLASRFMFYDPATQEDYFDSPDNDLALFEDQNGDGIGEFLKPGPVTLTSGEQGSFKLHSTGEFTGELRVKKQGSSSYRRTNQNQLVPEMTIDPAYDPAWITQPDFGLMTRFSDPGGCTAASPSVSSCPLLKRFYVLIDRHENFYQTYSAMHFTWYGAVKQPSPLVACSITLRASHHWDTAGIPSGGRAGFIYLFRVPFDQILAGTRKSVATLDPAPQPLAIQDLYDGSKTLDMSKVWLDIASLSNNLYSTEHEISKFGIVPAEQIEGLLVIRKPKAMDGM